MPKATVKTSAKPAAAPAAPAPAPAAPAPAPAPAAASTPPTPKAKPVAHFRSTELRVWSARVRREDGSKVETTLTKEPTPIYDEEVAKNLRTQPGVIECDADGEPVE